MRVDMEVANSFFSLPDLLTSYKESGTDCTTGKVCFMKAGTLSYKYEICCVIMVAMEGDMEDQVFPSIDAS